MLSEEYTKIIIPRSSANDDTVLLIEWVVEEAQEVTPGQVICRLESSKTVFELTAAEKGYLFHFSKAGQDIAVGEIIAVIAKEKNRPQFDRDNSQDDGRKITLKARKLIAQHNIDLADLDGIDIVREKHIRELLANRDSGKYKNAERTSKNKTGRFVEASTVQRRSAKVLERSVSEIPHSYLTKNISAELAEQVVGNLAEKLDIMLSLTDWLVLCVAMTAKDFEKVNASWQSDGVFYHDDVNVGFALNQANGELVVPVIRNADKMEIDAIAGRIRGFQKKAIRHKLTVDDLTGGTITTTSMIGTGVDQVLPIIFPGQSAIVAIGDRWSVGPEGFYSITIAFDHRVLNGIEAGDFLSALAKQIITKGTSTDE